MVASAVSTHYREDPGKGYPPSATSRDHLAPHIALPNRVLGGGVCSARPRTPFRILLPISPDFPRGCGFARSTLFLVHRCLRLWTSSFGPLTLRSGFASLPMKMGLMGNRMLSGLSCGTILLCALRRSAARALAFPF
jgi:hypothetical protein